MDTHSRHDIYAFIHKGLRKAMGDCLSLLGRVDPMDDAAFAQACDQINTLLRVCQAHVEHENTFIHPAIEARETGASRDIARQHESHEQHILHLFETLATLQKLPAAQRAAKLHGYYREFALWVADNFQHMEQEEAEHNASLWAHYSDEEILAIEMDLVAHIEPSQMPVTQAYMIAALTPQECLAFTAPMKQGMPPEVFAEVLELARAVLTAPRFQRLQRELNKDAYSLAAAI